MQKAATMGTRDMEGLVRHSTGYGEPCTTCFVLSPKTRTCGEHHNKVKSHQCTLITGRPTSKMASKRTVSPLILKLRNIFVNNCWISLVYILCVWKCLIPSVTAFNLDVTRTIVHKNNDIASMFGFTVSQFEENNVQWLLTGAPESATAQPGVLRPGAVFKCPVRNSSDCQELVFDDSGHEQWQGRMVSNKSLQWFGASLTSSSQKGYVVACAPRYVYFTRQFNKREPIGSCFLYDGTSNVRPYYPCKTEGHKFSQGNDKTMAQAGASVQFDAVEDKIVIGAVGSFYWQGQLIVQDMADPAYVQETTEAGLQYDDSYRGFAVTLGNFYGNRIKYIAVSSPKANEHSGLVQIYERTQDDLINIKNVTAQTGQQQTQQQDQQQIGEFFGYSLATGDFNADGRDDLVVGAPLYSSRASGTFDMGHVYVYGNLDKAPRVIEGRPETRSRFGFSVASIGDANDDGYDDLAVGAPYGGQDHRGIVYLFYGSQRGIRTTYSQVLEAAALSSTLMSFGYSLNGGQDQDDNELPDMLVGAQESAEIVLFRARPVVRVFPELTPSTKTIALDKFDCVVGNGTQVACYNLQTCVTYTGKSTPQFLRFNLAWKLDYRHRSQETRVYLLDGTTRRSSKKQLVTLQKDRKDCVVFKVYLMEEIRDKLHPIWTQFSYDLIEEVPPGGDIKPIQDHFANTLFNSSVDIEKLCGQDEICIPNLKLDVFATPPSYVFGNMSREAEIGLTVLVENLGEGAYESTLYVDLPPGVTYINYHKLEGKVDVVCTNINYEGAPYEMVICDVGNPLPSKQMVEFVIRTDPKQVAKNLTALRFDCLVNSTNSENHTEYEDNMKQAEVKLEVQTLLHINGKPVPEQVLFNTTQSTKQNKSLEELIGPTFIHRYVITNKGLSSISALKTEIHWPETLVDGSVIFYLPEAPKIVQGEGFCETEIIPVENITGLAHESKEADDLVESVLMTIFGGKSENEQKIYNVGCSGDPQGRCKKIQCRTGAMNSKDQVVIEATGRVHVKTVEEILKLYRGVNATSFAMTIPTSFPYEVQPEGIVPTTFQVEMFVTALGLGAGKQPLQWWIIALAVAGGLLLLILLGIGLWKCGFFKRNKFEDEEHLADKDEIADPPDFTVEKTNGKPQGSPPRVQVNSQGKSLYKAIPNDDF